MKTTIPRPALEARRQELSAALSRERSKVAAQGSGTPSADDVGLAAIAAVLARLGGGLAAFGRYLGSRQDLIPADQTRCLVSIPELGQPPMSARRRLAELGYSVGEIFSAFDEKPRATTWLYQVHRAHLPGGRPVDVRLLRSDAHRAAVVDLELLPRLLDSFPPIPGLRATIDPFRSQLAERLDLTRSAACLERLAGLGEGSEGLYVPAVYVPSLPQMLILEAIPGRSLGPGQGVPHPPGRSARGLARRLARVWLELALWSEGIPIEADWVELEDGRLAIRDAIFVTSSANSRVHLFDYLRAAMGHRPAEVAAALLRESDGGVEAPAELTRRLRQVTPLRSAAWSESADTLAEHLMLHWRAVHRSGLEPSPALRGFFQGLFGVARLAWQLDPEGDPWREVLEELQWRAGWDQVRSFFLPSHPLATYEQRLEAFSNFPRRLHDALERALAPQLQAVPRRPAGRLVSLRLMALVGLCGTWLASQTIFGEWLQGLAGFGGLMFFGCVFLFSLWVES